MTEWVGEGEGNDVSYVLAFIDGSRSQSLRLGKQDHQIHAALICNSLLCKSKEIEIRIGSSGLIGYCIDKLYYLGVLLCLILTRH